MTLWGESHGERARLFKTARETLTKAYAPYSRTRVGAAVLTRKGNIFPGCNVENASLGLTICAERSAILAAVAREGPEMRLRALVVLSETPTPFTPCGACRQVLLEFGPDAVVLFQGREGLEERRADQLLPEGFSLP